MRGFIIELPWEATMGSDADLGAELGGLGVGHGIIGDIGRGGGTSECGVN